MSANNLKLVGQLNDQHKDYPPFQPPEGKSWLAHGEGDPRPTVTPNTMVFVKLENGEISVLQIEAYQWHWRTPRDGCGGIVAWYPASGNMDDVSPVAFSKTDRKE